jgi:hypothetical protein
VGALAEAGEILTTVETLTEAGVAQGTDSREVTVKGVSAPLTVAALHWE